MAGLVTGGVPTSTGLSILPSNGVVPPNGGNPDNDPGANGPGGAGGSPVGSGGSSSINSNPSTSPTPTSQGDILPNPSSTGSATELPSPSVISFNDKANFGTDPNNTGRVFLSSQQSKLFSWEHDSATTPTEIFWYARNATGEPFDVSQATAVAHAKFGDKMPSSGFLSRMLPLTYTTWQYLSSVSNNGEGEEDDDDDANNGALSEFYIRKALAYGFPSKQRGFSQSGVFTVAEPGTIDAKAFGQEATDNDQDKQGGEQITAGGTPGNPTLPTSGPSGGNGNGNDISGSISSSGGHSGLSTGAIAGIAVACSVVGLALIGALVWFLLRRRRRRHFDEGYKATGQTTSSFIAAKEVQPSVAESPIVSPFSDDGEIRAIGSAMAAPHPLETAATATSTTVLAPALDDRADRPDSSASGNRSRGIAHLVEEGMTEADILRLEEEERHLDAEIERAARRTST
ncbi:hypothetical protein TARUN_7677 [Trichoderma arundinaceum]|uniref:Uncharacterized protein n=1 Tax=Trichoderma arundinaceum TaxID=490622 RepID=A0A395NEM5_TRIAR|nr:hypothetical protein TARUN_7677 [Trichoderma arundinaceum]